MEYIKQTNEIINKINKIGHKENKITGFCIGNTAKIDDHSLYFTPIRNTDIMILSGVIVYSEQQAVHIAKAIDGKVSYILVDAEKKIPDEMSLSGDPANVERAVREVIRKSKLWIYKGNDLSVNAVDMLLTQLTKNNVRGIGSKKIVILGAGNMGAKLALRFVERGSNVVVTRRDKKKLDVITKAINYIKPKYTTARVIGMNDNESACESADIIICATRGEPIVTSKIVKNLASDAFIIDVGKGCLFRDAIKTAHKLEIPIYRLDVSPAFEGLVHSLYATEKTVEEQLGRTVFNDERIVSGGLMGYKDEIVVDNINNPKYIYGLADGKGDFIRKLSKQQISRIEKIKKIIKNRKK